MAYRESFEACPRCGTTLEDAGDVRACNACQGQWVLETVIAEMVIKMLPAGVYGRLTLLPSKHGGGATACPSCGVRMDTVSMFGVEVERCPKQHGVWFDAEELGIALRRAADPARHVGAASLLPTTPPPAADAAIELVFGIQQPGDVYREVRVRRHLIKLGRLDVCQVQLSDERVARVHAMIEVDTERVVIMDLATDDGTRVNGARVGAQELTSGDRILIGATTITVTFDLREASQPPS